MRHRDLYRGSFAFREPTRRFARLALLIEKRARGRGRRGHRGALEREKIVGNHEVEGSEPGRQPRAKARYRNDNLHLIGICYVFQQPDLFLFFLSFFTDRSIKNSLRIHQELRLYFSLNSFVGNVYNSKPAGDRVSEEHRAR